MRELWQDQGGNTAIIFGLAIVPLIALGGGVVNIAQRAKVRTEMPSAADTAAIDVVCVIQLNQLARDEGKEAIKAEAEAAAERVLNATLANLGPSDSTTYSVEITDGVIRISTDAALDTAFLGVIGINTLEAEAMAEVNLPEPTLVEITLVLDYSGSMSDANKYIRVTNAAQAFIEKVEEEPAQTSKIGIVPFSEYIYAPMSSADIRDTGSGYRDHSDDGCGWGDGSSSSTDTVTTCLLNRGYPYSTTDETPSSTLTESPWPEGDDGKCDEYATNNLRVRDLTDDFDGLRSALSSMQPVGLTNISLAMEMGWHMLSPNRPFETARDYSDEHLEKIVILLTDGVQTVPAEGPSGDVSTDAANETTAELCDNAKDSDISIFSIAYDVNDPVVEGLLAGCASGASNYFDAGVSDISAVFEEIYAQIKESVWLSK